MGSGTGRNDPCPCGSGKKYKRCCLGKEPLKPLATEADPPTPAPPREEEEVSGSTSNTPALAEVPAPSSQSGDEWDDWFDRYNASTFLAKLEMLRALLKEDHPPEFYEDMELVSTILELPREPSHEEALVAFLEEMLGSRPEVFALGADWFVRHMAHAYIRGDRLGEIARLLGPLSDDGYKPEESAFDLNDLIRLADLREESRRLTFALLEQKRCDQYTERALEELKEFALFFLHDDAIRAGRTPEAMAELGTQLLRLECVPTPENLDAMLSHRDGTAGRKFMPQEFLEHTEQAEFGLCLLSLDFGRWLTCEMQIPPLVADTIRCFVLWCLAGVREKAGRNPLILHQERLDQHLATLLGYVSLLQLRGVATLVGMRHFQDFLLGAGLINEGEHRRAVRICDDLWLQVQRGLGDSAPNFAILNKYL